MKKLVLLLLCALLAFPTCAWAAKGIDVQQETLYYQTNDVFCDIYGYWEVQNTSEDPIFIFGAVLDLFNKDDASLLSDPMYTMFPSVLQPGESGYLTKLAFSDSIQSEDAVVRHELTTSGQVATTAVLPLKVAEIAVRDASAMPTAQVDKAIFVTVENDTQETVYNYIVVAGVYDEEGKLLFTTFAMGYEIGLLPGSKVEVCLLLNPLTVELAGGLDKIAEVRAMAYRE